MWREAKSLVADAFWGHLAFPHLFLFIIVGAIQVSHFAAVYFPWKCLSSSKRIMESWDPSSLLLYSSFCSLYLGGGGGGGANEVALSDLSKDSEGVNAWIALLFPVVAGDCGSMQKFFPPPPPPFLFPSPFLGIITAIIHNGTRSENHRIHLLKHTRLSHFSTISISKNKLHHFWMYGCRNLYHFCCVYILRELSWSGGSWKKKKKRGRWIKPS